MKNIIIITFLMFLLTEVFALRYANDEVRFISEKIKLENFLKLDEFPDKQTIIEYNLEKDGFTYPLYIFRDKDKIERIGLRLFAKKKTMTMDLEQKLVMYLLLDSDKLTDALKKDKVKIVYTGVQSDVHLFRKIVELTEGKQSRGQITCTYKRNNGYTIRIIKGIEQIDIFIPEKKIGF